MNMNNKIVYLFITFLSFTLFTTATYAACSDVKINSVTTNEYPEVKEQKAKCWASTENGFKCEVKLRENANGSVTYYDCKKSDKCTDGYVPYAGRCIKDDGGGGDTQSPTKCTNYTIEDDCVTMRHCEWINNVCTNTYVAEDPCSEGDILKALNFIGYLLTIARVAVPLIIIVVGTFDLFKSVVDKDEKSLTKQVKILLMRIVAGIFLFFLPTLIYEIFNISTDLNIVNDDKYRACVDCVLTPTKCQYNSNQ